MRVIGIVRQKYTILGHSVIPIHYLMSDGSEPSSLDKIAVVCCFDKLLQVCSCIRLVLIPV